MLPKEIQHEFQADLRLISHKNVPCPRNEMEFRARNTARYDSSVLGRDQAVLSAVSDERGNRNTRQAAKRTPQQNAGELICATSARAIAPALNVDIFQNTLARRRS